MTNIIDIYHSNDFRMRMPAVPSAPREDGLPGELGLPAELLLDPPGPVVLRGPPPPRRGARLDLARVRGHAYVADGGVLCLAGPVRNDAAVSGLGCELHGVERLGQRADLVDLDQYGVGDPLLDAFRKDGFVRDEHVVAHDLHLLPKTGRDLAPPDPVLLGHGILYRHDRERLRHVDVQVAHLLWRERLHRALLEDVFPTVVELARRDIHRQEHVLAWSQSRGLGCFDDEFERLGVRSKPRREPSLVADS